jgi:serine/threonine protein phosphatase PrpC
MIIEADGKSIPGSAHPYQDRIFLNRERQVFLVADGVSRSSHGDGGLAAGLILGMVEEEVEKGADLSTAVIKANDHLVKRRGWDVRVGETTFTGCLIKDDVANIVNVGDSPAYLFRKASNVRLYTEDKDPRRGYLTQVIGHPNISAHSATIDLQPGDVIALMTDGINKLDVGAMARPWPVKKIVDMVMESQSKLGYDDDKSIIVIRLS